MTYLQTLDYLYSRLPMFQRIGAAAYKADLNNTLAICKMLGNPEKKFKSVHVAGTNGKGSSSHMLAAILQTSGYKTGLYTSPHLKDFRERVRINGKMISKKYVTDFVKKHKKGLEAIEPSFFEWSVGLAFEFFAEQKVDIAIIEVGLGGRLDSTNVITPEVSLITNIGYDHVSILGKTLPLIAAEKAGIIKKEIPVVVSQYQKETAKVFVNKAKKEKAPICFADKELEFVSSRWDANSQLISFMKKNNNKVNTYSLDLTGSYQIKNLAGVLKTCELLRTKGFKKINLKTELKALKKVKKLTGLMGRWQTICRKPLTICDTGHNEDGIKEVLANLSRYTYKQLHMVIGVVNDKDVSGILKLLPQDALYYFTRASVPRALNEKELARIAKQAGLKGKMYTDVDKALMAAQSASVANDLVFIGGSTFVVADVFR
jgi:dihydrofolate synthase/folylpolyglutamate synthase